MKRLSELVQRVSLRDLVEEIVAGQTSPEAEPEGEEEFVKLHTTEKHPDRAGNKDDMRNASKIKKDTSAAGKEPKKGFPPEVKEAKNWFHKVGATTPNDEKKKEPSKKTKGDAYSRAEEKSKHVWHKDEKMTREETELDETSKEKAKRYLGVAPTDLAGQYWTTGSKFERGERDDMKRHARKGKNRIEGIRRAVKKVSEGTEELDEADAREVDKNRKPATIARPKFDARGNLVITQKASRNIGMYKPTSRKIKHGRSFKSSDLKKFGEEAEQLDEAEGIKTVSTKGYHGSKPKNPKYRTLTKGFINFKGGKPESENDQKVWDWHKAEAAKEGKVTQLRYRGPRSHAGRHTYNPAASQIRGAATGAAIYYKDKSQLGGRQREAARAARNKANESVEQLDELRQDTMFNYARGAVKSIGNARDMNTIRKRTKGLGQVVDRLSGTFEVGKPMKVMIPGRDDNDPGSGPYTMKRKKLYHAEETEQLDELSKKTLGRVDRAERKKIKGLRQADLDLWNKKGRAADKERIKNWEKVDKAYSIGKAARDRIHQRGKFKFYKTDERKNKEILDRLNWEETEQLDEKAVSKAQQRLFGIALATRRGETDRGGKEATRLAADLPAKELRKFAKTKHKGLPERKESK